MIEGALWIVLTGALVTASCALLGTFLVLRKMSLLGDALSHAVLPGIAVAFLLSGSRAVLPMFLGAAAFGLLTALLVESLHRRWRVQEDAAIGIVFTALFALGVVIITAYAGQVDLDQECVLYGEIAYTPWDLLLWGDESLGPRPVWILGAVLAINLTVIALLYKEFKIAAFDPAMAMSVGINAALMHYLLMGLVALTTVASFESVGAILVVAMLIVPGAAAYLWSDRLIAVLGLAVVFGIASAVAGYFLASFWNSSIAGAMVVVIGGIFLFSLLFSPNQGVLARIYQRVRLSLQVAQDHMLLALARRAEEAECAGLRPAELVAAAAVWSLLARLAFGDLRRRQLLVQANGLIELSAKGQQIALRLLRHHRLWETYMSHLGLPKDHVHDPADAIEHFIGRELAAELGAEISDAQDPQGKQIPPSN